MRSAKDERMRYHNTSCEIGRFSVLCGSSGLTNASSRPYKRGPDRPAARGVRFTRETDFAFMFGKTHSTKTADVEKKWLLIDAKGLIVGRLATIVAMRLRGKHKPSFTPHIDDGDNVIIVNAEKVVFTGRKRDKKLYYHYTGFIGGIKERSAKSILDGNIPSACSSRRSSACCRAARWARSSSAISRSTRVLTTRMRRSRPRSSTSPNSIRRTAGAPDSHGRDLSFLPRRPQGYAARAAARRSAGACAEARQAGSRLCDRQAQERCRTRLDQARQGRRRPSMASRSTSISPVRCCA